MKILIPIDFTKDSLLAFNYAHNIYGSYGVKYFFINIPKIRQAGSTIFFDLNHDYLKLQKGKMDELLADLRNQYVDCNLSGLVSAGTMVDNLLEKAEDLEVDLIVMATNGADEPGESFTGTNASQIVGYTRIPLLIVPNGFEPQPPGNVVFCIDKTKYVNESAVEPLLNIVQKGDANLSLLHVLSDESNKIEFNELPKILLEQASQRQEILGLDIEARIIEFVDENNIDLLVLLKHERSFFERLFHYSVSKDITTRTTSPILILRS